MTASPVPRVPVLNAMTSNTPDEVTIHYSGQLALNTCEQIPQTVLGLVSTSKRVVLDFSRVDAIDNAALGPLVALYLSTKRMGCEFKLRNMPKRIIELLSRWPEEAFETEKPIVSHAHVFRTNT